MENIYKYLRDPGWWFSAFVIAVVASVIAGFAKDYLERRFGVFLNWSRSRREERRQERARLIAAWSANETLLAVVLLQTLFAMVICVSMGIVCILLVAYLGVGFGFTGIGLVVGPPWSGVFVLGGSLIAFLYVSFRTVVLVSRASNIVKTFRRKRELPRFFE